MGRLEARSEFCWHAALHLDDSIVLLSDGSFLNTYKCWVTLAKIGLPLARGRTTRLHVYFVFQCGFPIDPLPSASQITTGRNWRKKTATKRRYNHRNQRSSQCIPRLICPLVRQHLFVFYTLGTPGWSSDTANNNPVFQLCFPGLYNSSDFRALEKRSRVVPQNIAHLLLHTHLLKLRNTTSQ